MIQHKKNSEVLCPFIGNEKERKKTKFVFKNRKKKHPTFFWANCSSCLVVLWEVLSVTIVTNSNFFLPASMTLPIKWYGLVSKRVTNWILFFSRASVILSVAVWGMGEEIHLTCCCACSPMCVCDKSPQTNYFCLFQINYFNRELDREWVFFTNRAWNLGMF